MIKFLVGECLGIFLARWLEEQGYDVVAVIEKNQGANDIMEKVLRLYSDDLPGNFTVATEETIRVVRMPVKSQA